MQWNVFKGVYFYWEKSTPQFKIELISGEYFFHVGVNFSQENITPGVKKKGGLIDVTMEAFDGAEVCENVGNCLLY